MKTKVLLFRGAVSAFYGNEGWEPFLKKTFAHQGFLQEEGKKWKQKMDKYIYKKRKKNKVTEAESHDWRQAYNMPFRPAHGRSDA